MTLERGCRLNVRLTEWERDAIRRRASISGLSSSEYVRRRALRDDDRPVIVTDINTLQKAYRDLRHAGGNLNQLAKAANRGLMSPDEFHRLAAPALEAMAGASDAVADFIREVRGDD